MDLRTVPLAEPSGQLGRAVSISLLAERLEQSMVKQTNKQKQQEKCRLDLKKNFPAVHHGALTGKISCPSESVRVCLFLFFIFSFFFSF